MENGYGKRLFFCGMIIIHRKEVLLVLGGKCMEGTKEKKENIPDAAIGLGGVLKIAWPAVFESFSHLTGRHDRHADGERHRFGGSCGGRSYDAAEISRALLYSSR